MLRCSFILSPLTFLSLIALVSAPSPGCGNSDAVHASSQGGLDETPTPLPFSLNQTYWTAFLEIDEPWITADTQVNMVLFEREGRVVIGSLYHKEGTLEVNDYEIEADQWLNMQGFLLTETNPKRILLEYEDFGHVLTLDADLSPHAETLKGYFIIDDEYEIWVEFVENWVYWRASD